jgi:uncharacterized protein (TIGR01777 family)
MKKRIVLAGGSGFLGQRLAQDFTDKGWEAVILSRQAGAGPFRTLQWDGRTDGPWQAALDGAEAVVNLTGKSVNCRYNEANRAEILASRLDSVRAIGRAIRMAKRPPQAWVQCGSLAIFGDAGDQVWDEAGRLGVGFSVEVCKAWEAALEAEAVPDTRKTLLRIGFVLAPQGGAMGTLEKIVRVGLGGSVGGGRQFISWLHIDDFCAMVGAAVQDPAFSGVYNATGLQPVTNAEFMAQLRRALRRPWSPPAPAWAARLGAWAMGTEAELALTGRRCMPRRLLEQGFRFKYWDLQAALADLYPVGA